MTAKARAPLTPAFATYLGLAQIEGADPRLVERCHILRWASQSREGKEHFSSCDERGGDLRCTCEWATHHGSCKHTLATLPTLAHFGVTFDPPPADPGGAALDAAQDALDDEQGDWETVGMSPEQPRGFWTATAYGPMHVSGDPHMSEETLGALREMAELAVRQHLDPAPSRLDEAVAAGGQRWLQSRTDAGVRLTCVACHAVRGWASEGLATAWLEGGGACGCGGPTPPAHGGARKPLDECLLDLYEG